MPYKREMFRTIIRSNFNLDCVKMIYKSDQMRITDSKKFDKELRMFIDVFFKIKNNNSLMNYISKKYKEDELDELHKASDYNQGIYQIKNKITGDCYIGSSCDISGRFSEHKHQLNKKIHCNKKLQSSWDKYGEESFAFYRREEVKNKKLIFAREKDWMEKVKGNHKLLNSSNPISKDNYKIYKLQEEIKELKRQLS